MIQANKTKTRVNLSGRDQKKESYLQSNISLAAMLDVVDKKGHRLETTNVLRITSYMDHLKIKVKVTDPSQFWETGQGHIYRKVWRHAATSGHNENGIVLMCSRSNKKSTTKKSGIYIEPQAINQIMCTGTLWDKVSEHLISLLKSNNVITHKCVAYEFTSVIGQLCFLTLTTAIVSINKRTCWIELCTWLPWVQNPSL